MNRKSKFALSILLAAGVMMTSTGIVAVNEDTGWAAPAEQKSGRLIKEGFLFLKPLPKQLQI